MTRLDKNILANDRPDLISEWDFERNTLVTPYHIATKSNKTSMAFQPQPSHENQV